MDEHRPVPHGADVAEHRQQVVEIVPVDRPDIVEAELLEQRAAGPEAAREFLGELRLVAEEARQPVRARAWRSCGSGDRRGPRRACEMRRHRADRRGDRHVVVVEDDDQPRLEVSGIVHRLIGHAGRHGAVADDGDDPVVPALEVAGDRHAEPGRDRGRGMRRAEWVVLALRAPGEARQPAGLAERPDPVAPAGQDLVRIGLVADVPDQAVARRVEDIVERDRQLDHAEPGAEMAAGDRDGRDRLPAELVGDLRSWDSSNCRRSEGRWIVSRSGVGDCVMGCGLPEGTGRAGGRGSPPGKPYSSLRWRAN